MKKTIFLTLMAILIMGGSIFAGQVQSDEIVEIRKQYRAPTANLSLELKKGSDTYNGEWVKNNVNVVVTKPSGLETMTDVYYKKAGDASYTAPVGAVYTNSTITLVFDETMNEQITFVGVDVSGNEVTLPTSAYTVKIDKTIPKITAVDKTATGTTVILNVSVEDLESGVKSYAVSTSTVASSWVTLDSTITTGNFSVEVGGEKPVYLWLQDSVGNVSEMKEVVIYKDITPPTGTIEIVGNVVDGITYVNSTKVTLKLTASDNNTATSDIKMKIYNEEDFDNLVSVDDIVWETFKTEVTDWNLTSVDGKKVVYLVLKDAMGNISVTIYGDTVNYTVHHFIKDVAGVEYALYKTTTEKTTIGKHITLANEQLILTGMTYEKVALSFDGTSVAETVVAEDGSTEVYVHYTRNKYNVTLNNGDGTYGQMTVTYGGTYEGLPELTREGYTFNGWRNETGMLVRDTTEVTITEDEELTANWIANRYTVTLDPNGGTVDPTTITVTYDALYQTLPEPTKTGYDFLGWYNAAGEQITKDSEVKITADETLTASWETARFEVTLDPNGGEVDPTTLRLLPNGTYESLPTPTKEGHTFTGWYTALNSGTKVESTTTVVSNTAHTLYAQWSVNTYTITFDSNGGTAVPSITQEYGTSITVPTYPTKEGWQFNGWLPKLPSTMPAENITLTADWRIQQYQITFNTDGGSAIDSIIDTYGATITAPANPTKTGYTFTGWDKTIPTTMPAEDMTITAKWTANTYTVTYNGNGNTSGSTANSSHTYDVESALTTNGFVRAGYTFMGWNTSADGTGTSYSNGASVTNLTETNGATITLYAKWQVRTYTVTFDANGGLIEETGATTTTRTETYGKTYAEGSDTVPTAIRDGYEFLGWNTSQDGSGTVITDDTVVTEIPQGMYVYAQWKPLENIAKAIYSADDNSLTFYNNTDMVTEGSTYNGKTATAIYTGFEASTYTGAADVPWYSNRNKIITVEMVDEITPVSTAYWFYSFQNATTIDVAKLNTTNVTTMRNMFNNCNLVTTLDVSDFETENVTDMYGVFTYCNALTYVDVSNWKTGKVTGMRGMFNYCYELTNLDVSGFDTSLVTEMQYMFTSCRNVTNLDLSGFNMSKVTDATSMFDGCYRLQEVTVSSNFKFVDSAYFPTPSSSYITGADGKWYNAATGIGYAPSAIPNNTAATYTAIAPTQDLASKVKVGDYVNYPVEYTNVATSEEGTGTASAECVGWRVVSTENGTIKLVSEGVPLRYYYAGTASTGVNDLTTNFLTTTYAESGFSGSLSTVFSSTEASKYTESVSAMTKTEVDGIYGSETVQGTSISNFDMLSISAENEDNSVIYWLATEYNTSCLWRCGKDSIFYRNNGTEFDTYDIERGVRPVVTLKDGVMTSGQDANGVWQLN